MAFGDIDPFSFESRAERRRREIAQFREMRDRVRAGLSEGGPVGLARAQTAAREVAREQQAKIAGQLQSKIRDRLALFNDRDQGSESGRGDGWKGSLKAAGRFAGRTAKEGVEGLGTGIRVASENTLQPVIGSLAYQGAEGSRRPVRDENGTPTGEYYIDEPSWTEVGRSLRRTATQSPLKSFSAGKRSFEERLRDPAVQQSAGARTFLITASDPTMFIGPGAVKAGLRFLPAAARTSLAARLAGGLLEQPAGASVGGILGASVGAGAGQQLGGEKGALAGGIAGGIAGGVAGGSSARLLRNRTRAAVTTAPVGQLVPVDPEELAFGGTSRPRSLSDYLSEVDARGGTELREIPPGRLDAQVEQRAEASVRRRPRLVKEPLGTALAQRAIAEKEATMRRPGALGSRLQGLKGIAGTLNPAARMERQPLIAVNARQAVRSELETGFGASRARLLKVIEKEFAEPPKYVGPSGNPIRGTFVDIAENPGDYQLTARQLSVLDAIDARNTEQVNLVRSQYGADIGLYNLKSEGGIYLPNLNTNDDEATRTLQAVQSLGLGSVSKERAYDTARARAIADKRFVPETAAAKLIAAHDHSLAVAAGNATMRLGTGGLTRGDLIDLLRPGLREAKGRTRRQVQNMKSRIETAERNAKASGRQAKATLTQLRAVQKTMRPIEADIAALGNDFGPGLSFLSGELRQLRLRSAALQRQAAKAGYAQEAGELTEATLVRGLDQVQGQLDKLVRQYRTVDTGPDYVQNRSTFRYHSPEESQTIDELLRVSNGAFDPLLGGAETLRQTVLGGDLSPLFIQGGLNVLRAPLTSAKTIAKMVAQRGSGLAKVAEQEPELMGLYTRARGRVMGVMDPEFSGSRSLIAKIPGVGGKYNTAEASMSNVIQRMEYETWKKTYKLLKGMGFEDSTAAYEAANAISKTGASLSPIERGVSAARSQLERTALTSPSFLASPALVIKDATSAFAKLAVGKKPQGREIIALQHSLNMAGTVAGLSLTSAALAAESRNKSVVGAIQEALDPDTKFFMAVQFGDGHSIPIGGPFRSFIKGVAPTHRDGKWGYPDLYQFGGGKLAPVPGTTVDLIRGRDFMGNSISQGADGWEKVMRQVEYAIENTALPLSLGGVVEGARLGEKPLDIAERTAGQFLGGNISGPSPTERLNQIARGKFDKNFYDLAPNQQQAIKDENPVLWDEAVDKGSEERQRNEVLKQQYREMQTADDQALLDGSLSPRKWADNRETRATELAGRRAEIYRESGQSGTEPWDQYFAKMESSKVNGIPDWDVVRTWVAQQTPAFQEQIDANVGLNATPLERLRKQLTNEYYELPTYRRYTVDEGRAIDELWELVRANSRSADDAVMLRTLNQMSGGRDKNIVVGVRRRILGLLMADPKRERWRRQHPAEYQFLASNTPLNPKNRAQIEALLQ